MSKKERFLKDLEKVFKKYDVGEHETEMYISEDGGEGVITVDIPSKSTRASGAVWNSVILKYRPYDLSPWKGKEK